MVRVQLEQMVSFQIRMYASTVSTYLEKPSRLLEFHSREIENTKYCFPMVITSMQVKVGFRVLYLLVRSGQN